MNMYMRTLLMDISRKTGVVSLSLVQDMILCSYKTIILSIIMPIDGSTKVSVITILFISQVHICDSWSVCDRNIKVPKDIFEMYWSAPKNINPKYINLN